MWSELDAARRAVVGEFLVSSTDSHKEDDVDMKLEEDPDLAHRVGLAPLVPLDGYGGDAPLPTSCSMDYEAIEQDLDDKAQCALKDGEGSSDQRHLLRLLQKVDLRSTCRDASGSPLEAQCDVGMLHEELDWLTQSYLTLEAEEGKEGSNQRHDHACGALRAGVAQLPLSTAAHDSRVLCAAGTSYPPCVRGAQGCVGASGAMVAQVDGRDAKFSDLVLMQYMTPPDLDIFEATGQSPAVPGLCLLCLRFLSAQFVVKVGSRDNRIRVDASCVFQRFRSKIDEVGEYRRDATLAVSPGSWAGFGSPLVMFEPSRLAWVKRRNRWVVDQSSLIYQKTSKEDTLPCSPAPLSSSPGPVDRTVGETCRTLLLEFRTSKFLESVALWEFLKTDCADRLDYPEPSEILAWIHTWHRRWVKAISTSGNHVTALELPALLNLRPDVTFAPPPEEGEQKAWRLRARWTLLALVFSTARAPAQPTQPAKKRERRRKVILNARYRRDHRRFIFRTQDKDRHLALKHILDDTNRRFFVAPSKLAARRMVTASATEGARRRGEGEGRRRTPSSGDWVKRTVARSRFSQAVHEVLCTLAEGLVGNPGPGTWRSRATYDNISRWLREGGGDADSGLLWNRVPTPASPAHAKELLANVFHGSKVETSQGSCSGAIAHVFYKALPRPSQVREFNGILRTRLLGNAEFRANCARWTQNTLLGTYRHCGVRAHPLRSQEFAEMCAAPLSTSDVVLALLDRSDLLMLLVVREHLLFAVEGAPFAEEVLGGMFCFRTFRRRTVLVADRLRLLVNVCGWRVLFGRTPYLTDAWLATHLDGRTVTDAFSASGKGRDRIPDALPRSGDEWRRRARGEGVVADSDYDRRVFAVFSKLAEEKVDIGGRCPIGTGTEETSSVEANRLFVAAVKYLAPHLAPAKQSVPRAYDAVWVLFTEIAAAGDGAAAVAKLREWGAAGGDPLTASAALDPAGVERVAKRWSGIWEAAAKRNKHVPPDLANRTLPLPLPLRPVLSGNPSLIPPSKRSKGPGKDLFVTGVPTKGKRPAPGKVTAPPPPPPPPPKRKRKRATAPRPTLALTLQKELNKVQNVAQDLWFVEESQKQLSDEFYLGSSRNSLAEKLSALLPPSTRTTLATLVPARETGHVLALTRAVHRYLATAAAAADTSTLPPPPSFADTIPWLVCFNADARAVGTLRAFCLDFSRNAASDKCMHTMFQDINEHSPVTFALWVALLCAFEVCTTYEVQRIPYPAHARSTQRAKKGNRALQLAVCDICNTAHSSFAKTVALPGVRSTRFLELDVERGVRVCPKAGGHRRALDIHHHTFGRGVAEEVDLSETAVRTATGTYFACFRADCKNAAWVAAARGGSILLEDQRSDAYRGGDWLCRKCIDSLKRDSRQV
jgi:hypothetical protein